MDFLFSAIWYWLVCKFVPDKPTSRKERLGYGKGYGKDNTDMLIINEMVHRDNEDDAGGLFRPEESSDPFINGESQDGPEW